MAEGVGAGWYPDPGDPAHLRYWDGATWAAPNPTPRQSNAGTVFRVTWLYCILIGAVTGAGSGTVAVPVFGTFFGGLLGLGAGVCVGALIAATCAAAARPEVSGRAYRRTVDVTLALVGVASAVFAGLFWYGVTEEIALRGAIAIFVIAVICLVVVRPRLRRLVPA